MFEVVGEAVVCSEWVRHLDSYMPKPWHLRLFVTLQQELISWIPIAHGVARLSIRVRPHRLNNPLTSVS